MEIIDRIGKYKLPNRSWYTRPVKNITRLTIHHDAIPNNGRFTDEEVLNNIMREHINRGWPGASYHFWVSKSGKIYQLNDFDEITWHDGINSDSIGICFNGYFHPNYNEVPTKQQLIAFKELLTYLCTERPDFPATFKDIRGHRERKPTACPGNNFFPYVVEFREKEGNVSWGSVPEPVVVSLNVDEDIPGDAERKLGLKDYSWYTDGEYKYMSIKQLLKKMDHLMTK